MSPDFRVCDLVAGYGPRVDVVRGVSLEVGAGDAVSVVGSNGAGKTTLLRTISGLLRPRAGSIQLGADELAGLPAHHIARSGVVHVPEGRQVFLQQTVRDNLLLGAMQRHDACELMQQILAIFPALQGKQARLGRELSGGEQQMLAIARGLMSQPRVLMLDEPSLGLSPRLVNAVIELLGTIRDQLDTALLLVEQNALMAAEATERTYVMRRGEVVLEDKASRLLASRDLMRAYFG